MFETWHMGLTPVRGRQRLEDLWFKDIQGYSKKPCLKKLVPPNTPFPPKIAHRNSPERVTWNSITDYKGNSETGGLEFTSHFLKRVIHLCMRQGQGEYDCRWPWR